jgi:hypothetical protein
VSRSHKPEAVVEGRPVLNVRAETEEQIVAALADLLLAAMEREQTTPARRQPAGVHTKGAK